MPPATTPRAASRAAKGEALPESTFTLVRFDVDAGDGDRWSDALLDAGALSVDASDPAAGSARETPVFAEAPDSPSAWWPITRLMALCATSDEAPGIMERAAAALARPLPAYETARLEDRDWVRATQAQFGPLRITEDLWIVPTWSDPPRPDAVNVRLDPGLAFGTGAHPTTRLCLAWLATSIGSGASVLDYGCGSGILAIAAAKLGAARAVGVDIDAQALRASRDNARMNEVDVQFVLPGGLPPATFALVVANILANPLRLLAPLLAARTHLGGRIALSGILASQADAVVDTYARWFAMDPWSNGDDGRRDGDWVLMTGTRRDEAR